jgi:hypothetical protein
MSIFTYTLNIKKINHAFKTSKHDLSLKMKIFAFTLIFNKLHKFTFIKLQLKKKNKQKKTKKNYMINKKPHMLRTNQIISITSNISINFDSKILRCL